MFKTFLKQLAIVILELAIISGLLFYVAQKKEINSISQLVPAIQDAVESIKQGEAEKQEPVFPQLENPSIKKFNWEYKGKKYSFEKTLYQSVYEYYKNQPKKYAYSESLPANWRSEYYLMFLKTDPTDKTIEEIASEIKKLGENNNLNDDEIVELAVSFIQSISYDDAKSREIFAQNENALMRFPYETLYDQLGVCSDKSLLAYLLLNQMGYGTALFTFEQEKHMAAAIACPQEYSSYKSGYCYVETTSMGNKIGIIPNFDAQSGKAVDMKQLSDYDQNQDQLSKIQKLGQVEIFLAVQGKQYSGIIQTAKIINRILQLLNEMEELSEKIILQKEDINKQVEKLEDLAKDLEKYADDKNVEKYNSTAEKYNNLLSEYKKDVKEYNNNVAIYNKKIKEYNILIKQ